MGSCCPYTRAFDILGKRHALQILWFLIEASPRRFTEIKLELSVNQATLTQRLGDLEAAGILSRQSFAETPPRVEYSLTTKGQDLVPILRATCDWASRWKEEAATQPS